MNNFNTSDKRDEIRRQQNKPWYVKSPWFEKELSKVLDKMDEMDKLEKELDKKEAYITELFDECETCRPKIEQRTKEAIKSNLPTKKEFKESVKQGSPDEPLTIGEEMVCTLLMDMVKQAIDSAGEMQGCNHDLPPGITTGAGPGPPKDGYPKTSGEPRQGKR